MKKVAISLSKATISPLRVPSSIPSTVCSTQREQPVSLSFIPAKAIVQTCPICLPVSSSAPATIRLALALETVDRLAGYWSEAKTVKIPSQNCILSPESL